jgi:hypothetical protein
MTVYDRDVLVEVLVYHRDREGPSPYAFSCACGWGTRPEHLALSFAAHIADIYEESMLARYRASRDGE